MELNSEIAKMILKPLRENGQPPKFGLEHFSSGFEDLISVLDKTYLQDIIMKKGSSFKLISASYGGGKTHLLYQIREKAWEQNYATCYVALDYKNTQFHKLLQIFQGIIHNLQSPLSDSEKIEIFGEAKKPEEIGLPNLIKKWYHKKQNEFEKEYGDNWSENIVVYADTIRDFEDIQFGKVVRAMFKSLVNDKMDDFENLILWFCGQIEGGIDKKFGIKKPAEAEAFRMIKSLSKLLTDYMGFTGLIIFFDEGEREALRSKDKDNQMANLRQVIDQCGDQSMSSILFIYTVPDETEFLNPKNRSYDAVKQRLRKYFSLEHPLSPNISLEKLLSNNKDDVISNLTNIGIKISNLYEVGYDAKFPNSLKSSVSNIADSAFESQYQQVSIRRIFIQSVCEGLDLLNNNTESEITVEIAKRLVRREQETKESEEDT